MAVKFELFGRLKKRGPPAVPLDRVRQLLSQGMAEADIAATLKREGHTVEQIAEALRSVGIAVPPTEAPQTLPPPTPTAPPRAPGEEELLPTEEAGPFLEEYPEGMAGLPPAMPHEAPGKVAETEAILEELVEEKFANVTDRFAKLDNTLKGLEEKMAATSAQLQSTVRELQESHEGVKAGTEALDVKISDLEPRISSLEKAFKDIIPNLVDTVREVREIVATKVAKPKSPFERVEGA